MARNDSNDRKAFREEVKEKIESDEAPSFQALTDGRGGANNWKMGIRMSDGSIQNFGPAGFHSNEGHKPGWFSTDWDAGHTKSSASGENLYSMEDRAKNRSEGATLEKDGRILEKPAVVVEGLSVNLDLAQSMQDKGLLKPGTVESAPSTLGWSKESGLLASNPEQVLTTSLRTVGAAHEIDTLAGEISGDPSTPKRESFSQQGNPEMSQDDNLPIRQTSPTTMHIQTKEEQDRRNQQIAEQEPVAISQAGMPSGFREEVEKDQQEPAATPEGDMEKSSQSLTQKEAELENQPTGSMEVHEATQADIATAAEGNGNGGGGGPPDDNDNDLSKASFGTATQNVRDEFIAGQHPNETPAIDRLEELQSTPERDPQEPAIDRVEEPETTPERDQQAPAIDGLEESEPAPEPDQQVAAIDGLDEPEPAHEPDQQVAAIDGLDEPEPAHEPDQQVAQQQEQEI